MAKGCIGCTCCIRFTSAWPCKFLTLTNLYDFVNEACYLEFYTIVCSISRQFCSYSCWVHKNLLKLDSWLLSNILHNVKTGFWFWSWSCSMYSSLEQSIHFNFTLTWILDCYHSNVPNRSILHVVASWMATPMAITNSLF